MITRLLCRSSLAVTIDKYNKMKNLESIAEDLFNKIRGRFPSVTIGSEEGKVTNVPKDARYFDFDYKEGNNVLGKVSISLDEKSIAVMYSDDFVANEDTMTRNNWYNFLKELRVFSKKRMLNFDTRNITKSNLDRRDYKFLATTRIGDEQMTESTMYGTSKTSFQNIGNARLSIKHNQPVNQEVAADRARHIGAIYIESDEGERFKYPYKHLAGARAMARHVAEGGKPFDDFGQHITGLSEELSKLRKFKTYMGRSSVMAESLSEYVDAIAERMDTIRKTLKGLQRESFYKESFEGFEKPVVEDVPADVAENWIDQLTIRQFNEELKDVFPFVYKVVSEYTKAKELGPDDLMSEAGPGDAGPDGGMRSSPRPQARPTSGAEDPSDDISDRRVRGTGSVDRVQGPANTVKVRPGMTIFSIAQMFNDQNNMGDNVQEFAREIMRMNRISNPRQLQVGQVLKMPYAMGTGPDGAGRGLPPGGFTNYESQIEAAFEEIMGQFSEADKDDPCWKGYKQIGMKKKGGKEVPNCVPEDIEEAANDCDESCPKSCPDCGGTGDPEKYQAMKAKKEGNAYAQAVHQAKMNGKKKGDKIDGPDGEEITLEKKTPLGEFILSYFDYTTGQFPKGETAILTMVEKDYGEQYITPAKQFIERINNRVAEVMGYREEPEVDNTELNNIRSLAGL